MCRLFTRYVSLWLDHVYWMARDDYNGKSAVPGTASEGRLLIFVLCCQAERPPRENLELFFIASRLLRVTNPRFPGLITISAGRPRLTLLGKTGEIPLFTLLSPGLWKNYSASRSRRVLASFVYLESCESVTQKLLFTEREQKREFQKKKRKKKKEKKKLSQNIYFESVMLRLRGKRTQVHPKRFSSPNGLFWPELFPELHKQWPRIKGENILCLHKLK